MTRQPLALLAALVFFCHFLITGGHLTSPDEELLYRTAESIAFRGSTQIVPLEADLSTGLLPAGFPAAATFASHEGHNPGTFYAQYLPLQPLLAVPLVWLGSLTEGLFAESFSRVLWPSMATQYVSALEPAERAAALWRRGVLVMFFGPIVSALSAVFLARLVTLLTGCRRRALFTAGLWAFTTIGFAHARTFFTEPLAGLFLLLAIDQLVRWNLQPAAAKRTRNALLLGVALALANWTRVDSPFFTVGVMGAMLFLAIRRHILEDAWAHARRFPWMDLFFAGALALGAWIALQTFNTFRFGADPTSGYGDQAEGVQFTTPIFVGLYGLLFSIGKGIFFFSPGLLLAAWGWMHVPRHFRWLPPAMALSLLPFFIAMATWQNWDGGWCWGPRHIIQIHLPLMLGAAWLLPLFSSIKRVVIVPLVASVGIAVQLYGSSQSPTDYYREFFLTTDDLLYHRINLRGMQESSFQESFQLSFRDGTPASPHLIPAPMIDSLFLPEHSQWVSYRLMWRYGYSDWYWYNALREGTNPDRWSAPQP